MKEAVLPFDRFPELDTVLGPEMRSTGEVMGIDRSFGLAFAKSQAGAGNRLPAAGTVFLSLADRDKARGGVAARRFAELGFRLAATAGTAASLEAAGLRVDTVVSKVGERRPDAIDAVELISSGKVDLVVNTPHGRGPRADGDRIRRAATRHRVACITTVAAASAAAAGIAERAADEPRVARPPGPLPAGAAAPRRLRWPPTSPCGSARSSCRTRSSRRPEPSGTPTSSRPSATRPASAPSPRSPKPPIRGPGTRRPASRPSTPGSSTRSACRAPASTSGSATTCRRCAPTARRSSPRSGAAASTTSPPARPGPASVRGELAAVEVNVSCPNLAAHGRPFAHDAAQTGAAVAAVTAAGLGLLVLAKLAPDVTDLPAIAAAALDAGADGLTLVNTARALAVDAATRRPVLGAGPGGLSGPPLKPVALRAVAEVASAHPGVPIVGTGGVTTGLDAVEMLLAGATAFSAFSLSPPGVACA